MPRRPRGKDPVLNTLLNSGKRLTLHLHALLIGPVEELCKQIEYVNETMHTVAEKTVDASGLLPSSGHGTGSLSDSGMRNLDIGESESTSVEGPLWAGIGALGTLSSWEPQGGFCTTVFDFP